MAKKILKFEAEWCGQCKALSPILKKVINNHKDITLEIIDVEANEDVVSKYGIRNLPTLIFENDSKEIKRTTGVLTAEALGKIIAEVYA